MTTVLTFSAHQVETSFFKKYASGILATIFNQQTGKMGVEAGTCCQKNRQILIRKPDDAIKLFKPIKWPVSSLGSTTCIVDDL